jgi:hypothetical protein
MKLHGALWCIGGILLTVGSYSAASGGGTYVIAWGAILFGALQFFKGLAGGEDKPNTEDMAYEAFAVGTRLEAEGRVEEALVVYKAIIDKYPQSGASKDAKMSIESLQGAKME